MNISKTIIKYINKMPLGEPFTSGELLKYGSRANVDQILSRLVKANKLTRVARGIFARPELKAIPYMNIGAVLPEPDKIASAIARSSGEIITVQGAEAARQLQLTTQVPMQSVFLTSGSTRHVKVGNVEIVLKHVAHRKLAKANTIVGLVILALWYIGKKRVNIHVLEKLKNRLSERQFQLVQENVAFMPAWMADVFYHYHKEHSHVH